MDQEQYRKIATSSGSAVIVIGLLYFFFLTDAASDLPFHLKATGTVICIGASLLALSLFFLKKN